MIIIGAANAVFRYLGRFIGVNLSSNVYLELQWYLFSVVFLLGAAFALREDAHVRVDVVFAAVSARARSWINILGAALLLIPFCAFAFWASWPSVMNSWQLREGSPDPEGLPRYPLKTLVLLCFALLVLQGIAEIIKEFDKLRRHAASDSEPVHVPEGI
jgi:TRAP-type mannitol/chloroaromatic compound transport system permease small subunit